MSRSLLAFAFALAACSPARHNPAPPTGNAPWSAPGDGQQASVAVAGDARGTVDSVLPPPVSGGTLYVARDGTTAVAADPDRGRVYLVDLGGPSLVADIVLGLRDQPGRIAEDATRRAYVVLRGAGQVAVIDLDGGDLLERRDVCPAPRGIAYDPARDRTWVACAGGELVAFAADGTVAASFRLQRDLRDVVIAAGGLYVTTFRSAQLIEVAPENGQVLAQMAPPPFQQQLAFQQAAQNFAPEVAWRAIALGGAVAMVHQRALTDVVPGPMQGGYGPPPNVQSCGSIVHSTVTLMQPGHQVVVSGALPKAVLPVDVAVSPDLKTLAIVSAGNDGVVTNPQVEVQPVSAFRSDGTCIVETGVTLGYSAQAVAAAFVGSGKLWVQTREPATLQLVGQGNYNAPLLALSEVSRYQGGHHFFHQQSGKLLACASCHPEAGEDGHVWRLDNFNLGGPRRTQSLKNDVTQRNPFHWTGDLPGFPSLIEEVFVTRMGGTTPAWQTIDDLNTWMASIDIARQLPAADPAAVARGAKVFNGVGGCASCHTGAQLTDRSMRDVGTGRAFKVPSLVGVAWRAPFLHDGCAKTLADRFNPACGGAMHGNGIDAQQIADLIAFLETL